MTAASHTPGFVMIAQTKGGADLRGIARHNPVIRPLLHGLDRDSRGLSRQRRLRSSTHKTSIKKRPSQYLDGAV